MTKILAQDQVCIIFTDGFVDLISINNSQLHVHYMI